MSKKQVRRWGQEQRKALTEAERKAKSQQIARQVIETALYQQASVLLIYIDYQSEVETQELIQAGWKQGKKVYCPRVEGKNMEFYPIFSMEDLEEGYKGIREPSIEGRCCFQPLNSEEGYGLMILPGTAFDKERNRIGYGKGYYDRYLERYPSLATIGICFACQLADFIPAEPYDKKPDILITERETILPPEH